MNATHPRKPGSGMFSAALLIGVIGLILTIVGANSTDAYGNHTGSPGASILLIVIALVLVAVGFAQRIVAALENRNH